MCFISLGFLRRLFSKELVLSYVREYSVVFKPCQLRLNKLIDISDILTRDTFPEYSLVNVREIAEYPLHLLLKCHFMLSLHLKRR